MTLPTPRKTRWQPLRSGFLNVFKFQHEEFWYEDGHLLLRGNNGSGKSRILALQLPFLLDGDVSPHRLEPDGDAAKKIEWNLLMGKFPDRRGYTWLELGRLDEEGRPCYLTIGCGLYAVEGRSHTKWFFVTRQRVGETLFLQTPQSEALSQAALGEALGDEGTLFTKASDYRRELDRRLFQLGEHRYAALINLLIQLRQPQLSRDLDEGRLSSALGEALPPPDPQVLADVAEAFRELEADRLQLEGLAAARSATEAFHQVYVRYAQVALRRRATGVRQAHARYEATQRSLKAAEAEREGAQGAMEAAERALAASREEQLALTAEIRTLRESPEMRSAAELTAAREAALGAARAEAEATQRAGQDAELAARRAAERAVSSAAADELGAEAGRLAAEVQRAAVLRGLATSFERMRAAEPGLDARAELQWATDEARGAQRHLAKLVTAFDEAGRAAGEARSGLDAAKGAADEAAERLAAADDDLAAATATHLAATRAWAQGLDALAPLDAEALEAAAAAWAEAPAGHAPIDALAQAAWEQVASRHAAERADLEARSAEAGAARAALLDERQSLEAGAHRPPAPSPTRDAAARMDRPGAPFWRLVDFKPEVGPEEQAGLEAALEAAGLLDAWVSPDGRIDAAGLDAFLAAGPAAGSKRGGALALDRWLRPDEAAPGDVGPAVVAGLLARIGGERDIGAAWVTPAGTYGLGPLQGAWRKQEAEHIGQSAREAARARRLEALAAAVAEQDAALAALATAAARLAERVAAARAELAARPDPSPIIRAAAEHDGARRQLASREAALEAAERRAAEARLALDAALRARDEGARDLGLADWVADLPGLEAAIRDFAHAAQRWLDGQAHLARAVREAQGAADRAAEAEASAGLSAAATERATARRVEAASRFDTLEALVGTGVKELLARLAAAEAREGALAGDVQALERQRLDAFGAYSKAEAQAQERAETLAHDADRREAAIATLARLAERELWEVALEERAEPPDAWSPTRAVELARTVEARLAAVPAADEDWQRLQARMHHGFTALGEALTRQDLFAEGEPLEELFLVSVTFRERRLPVHALRAELVQEVTARQTILSAREKELLENHLVGEVAEHLHERLHEAEKLVAEMNREILRCETSTGMTLRFRWAPADDALPGLKEALDKLRRRKLTWSPADRALLGAFLQDRIQAERAKGGGAWHEQLAQALDYREWHRFSIERKQDGDWKRLTRRTHGTGSGGEKAIALTIPQFAAAAAHYRSAHPAAPRLILLDEAFVGVDKAMRAKCMGLIDAFDLDFVMTSESEWACYATLPGVAIYQLAVRAGIDAVYATRWVWNGRERSVATPVLAAAAAPTADDGQLPRGLG